MPIAASGTARQMTPPRRVANLGKTTARARRLPMGTRKQQLVETAVEVFASHGFRGTTTRLLARAAGVTEAAIFKHFPDKDAIYAAVLEQKSRESGAEAWLDELARACASADDELVLRTLFGHIVRRHERDADVLRLMIFAALERHPLARRMQDAQRGRLYQLLEAFVIEGQRAGRIRAGSPAALVRLMLAAPSYHVMLRRLFKPAWPAVDAEQMIDMAVQFTIAGLRPSVAPRPRSRMESRA